MNATELVEPAYVADGDRVYVYAGPTEDEKRERWRPAKVLIAAGDSARIAYKNGNGEIVAMWYSLRVLRVLSTDANAPGSAAYLEVLRSLTVTP